MKISFIIPTLYRSQLFQTVSSIKSTCPCEYEILVGYDPEVNEYVSRNRAVKQATGDILAFIDDDAYYPPHSIEHALKCFENPDVLIVDGSVVGNVLGTGNVRFSKDHLGIGTTLFIRRMVFNGLGGYPVDTYGTAPGDGWRMDTIMLYDILREYGERAYQFCDTLDVMHPNPFGSTWNPYIEYRFYEKYHEEIHKYILSAFQDYRLQDIERNYETITKAIDVLGKDKVNEIVRENGNKSFDMTVMSALKRACPSKQ